MKTLIIPPVSRSFLLRQSVTCIVIAILAHASLSAGIVFGGFDASRGGSLSFDGGGVTGAQASLQTAFPGATFVTANQITPAFLSGVDVVILGAGTANNAAIVPLSTTEQDALKNFVLGGGGAILFTDNDTFAGAASQPANDSLANPFGFVTTGTLNNAQGMTMNTPGADPISGGPFGTVSATVSYWPGWFSTLPASAVEVASLDANGNAALCYLPKGSMSVGSGGLVIFSDGTLMADGYAATSDYILLDNSVAYVIPESTGFALFAGVGLLALALRRRLNRAA